jgi:hypothetical protein
MKRKKAFPKKDAAAIGAIQQLLCFYEIKNPITTQHRVLSKIKLFYIND